MINYLNKYIKLFNTNANPFVNYPPNFNIKNWFLAFIYIFFPRKNIVSNFEIIISKMIGEGSSLSFASGRMAFFAILTFLKLKIEDEVLILVPNCSVMYNAIQRVNAKIIPYDVDLDTLGSSFENIEKHLTVNTKVIVVQHTLGIPCDIERICSYCEKNNIILIEDCALTFGSRLNNKPVGNFGSYAIFSFDSTKPINAIIGGIIYSKNSKKIDEIRNSFSDIDFLSKSFQFFILFNAFINKILRKNLNWFYNIFYLASLFVLKKIGFKYKYPYLYNDSDPFDTNLDSPYPYPAKISPCFAYLGTLNLNIWDKTSTLRKFNFYLLINYFKNKDVIMPKSYFKSNLEIIPLRFILYIKNESVYFNYLSEILPRNSMWFVTPLACNNDYSNFGINEFEIKNCLVLNKTIFNIPVDDSNIINQIINSNIYV